MANLHELIMGNAFKAFIENAQNETRSAQELALYSAKLAQAQIAEEQKAAKEKVDFSQKLKEGLKVAEKLNTEKSRVQATIGVSGKGDISASISPVKDEKEPDVLRSLKTKADLASKLSVADPMFAGRLAKEIQEEYDYLIDQSNQIVAGQTQQKTSSGGTQIPLSNDVTTADVIKSKPGAGLEYGPAIKGKMQGITAGVEQAEKERISEQTKLQNRSFAMQNFFNDMDLAFNELSQTAPIAGESSFYGLTNRLTTVPFKKATGELPYTKALKDRAAKLVYPMAKYYDPGGRLAKDDVEAFQNIFGLIGQESNLDVAVKGALELRDLVQTMNIKGADGDKFLSDFINQSSSKGGIFKMIADEYANKVAQEQSVINDETAYREYLSISGR